MRDFIIKYFGRILALLSCATMVTACYGIPVDPETHWIEGLVKDAEAGKPIKGIDGKVAQEITIYPYAPTDKLISTLEAGDFVVEMTSVD